MNTIKFNDYTKRIKLKTLSGHLTVTEIRAIKAMLFEQVFNAKVGKKTYLISEDNGLYLVRIKETDKSLVYGTTRTHRATFKIR